MNQLRLLFPNTQAVEHNLKVKNGCGSEEFLVTHSGGIISKWFANNRKHLDRLLAIDKNLGYILFIEKIQSC